MIRLFVAIDIPDKIKGLIAGLGGSIHTALHTYFGRRDNTEDDTSL